MADFKRNIIPTCLGTGLIALDVIFKSQFETLPFYQAGGSCGNVLSILSFLGWDSYPIARLSDNKASEELLNDFNNWNIKTKLISKCNSGSTPIIIHRILKDKNGNPKHKFEFKDPESGAWLPGYKPFLVKDIDNVIDQVSFANVFYFDRVNRAAIELAKYYKNSGSLIVFEPSSMKDIKLFRQALEVTHILKFSSDRIPDYKDIFPEQQVILEIETLGKEGLKYRFNVKLETKDWKLVPSYSINEAFIKDSAGAGDWCTAGIIRLLGSFGYLGFIESSELDIEVALKYGQVLGAINCCFDGARGIMYNMDQISLDVISTGIQRQNNYDLLKSFAHQSFSPKKSINQKLLSLTNLF